MKFWPRGWVFPGGHIDPDEGLDEGALRELHEEVGVKVDCRASKDAPKRRIYTYEGHEIAVDAFYAFESSTNYDKRDP